MRLQRRLEIEQDALFRASKNIKSIHRISGINAYDAFKKKLPIWVNKGKKNLLHKQRQGLVSAELKKISEGWPDISEKGGRATRNAFNTFSIKEMKAVIIPEGETLYRVLDPSSADNSICWMRESEFKKLKSKADWRKKFAVWPNWNNNGEFITYKVPPGGIKVWEGPAASQTLDKSGLPPYGIEKLPKMEQDKILKREREIKQDANQYSLEGGGKQIVLEPKDLQISQISERKKTNWGYGDSDLGHSPNLVGVPILSNKV